MKKSLLFFVLLASLPAVFADIITPFSLLTLPLIPIIILVEVLVIVLFFKKVLSLDVKLLRIFLAVLVANVKTALIGTFIPIYKSLTSNLMWIGVAFVASVFVEFGVYIPFFRKFSINLFKLLGIVFIANLITYAFIVSSIYDTIDTSKNSFDFQYATISSCEGVDIEVMSVCKLSDEGFVTNYQAVIANNGIIDIDGFDFRFYINEHFIKTVSVSDGVKEFMVSPVNVSSKGISGVNKIVVFPVIKIRKESSTINMPCPNKEKIWTPESDNKLNLVSKCET